MSIEQPGIFIEGKTFKGRSSHKVVTLFRWIFIANFHFVTPRVSWILLKAASTSHPVHFSCSINPIDFSTQRCAMKTISS